MKLDVDPGEFTTSSQPWPARKLMLVTALLLVTLVNIVHMSLEQSYFAQIETNEAVILEEETLDVIPPSPPSPSPTEAKACAKLHKSHVEEAYYREDACFTREEIQSIIKQLVFTAAAAFESHNVTYFLDSGTLLGAFRTEQVISHDNDADFGIDAIGLQFIQQKAIEFPSGYVFTVWNSSLYPNSTRDDKLPARLIHKDSGIYLDVFAFLDWEDDKVGPLPSWCFFNCAKCPKVDTGGKALKVERDWIYPLQDCAFEGATLKCPHRTKTYLEYTFGPRFMMPVEYSYR